MENKSLTDIQHELTCLKYDLEYEGFDPNRPDTSQAVAKLCSLVIDLIEVIEERK